MGGVFTDTVSLMAAIQNEMKSAMTEASLQSFIKAHENANDFYSVTAPNDGKKHYDRTGTYGTAPNTTGVTGGGNHLATEIYMEEAGHGYRTGTFSAREVWEAAENHTAGVLGLPGRWAQTEEDTKRIFKEVFSSHFD